MRVYFVFLRRPKDLKDRRNDPFWEFGSFGKTGCHQKNLLHPQHSPLVDGDRLAFIQGGKEELRIVGLTPPITVAGSLERIEVRWDMGYRPTPYMLAPLLINNDNESAFPSVFSALRLRETNRSTPVGAASSRLRSRKTPINHQLSKEIAAWFSAKNIPRIAAYPEAVQPQGGSWYRYAVLQGWAHSNQRKSEYRRAGRRPVTQSNVESGKASNGKRRC